jgi:hypothetical protein
MNPRLQSELTAAEKTSPMQTGLLAAAKDFITNMVLFTAMDVVINYAMGGERARYFRAPKPPAAKDAIKETVENVVHVDFGKHAKAKAGAEAFKEGIHSGSMKWANWKAEGKAVFAYTKDYLLNPKGWSKWSLGFAGAFALYQGFTAFGEQRKQNETQDAVASLLKNAALPAEPAATAHKATQISHASHEGTLGKSSEIQR